MSRAICLLIIILQIYSDDARGRLNILRIVVYKFGIAVGGLFSLQILRYDVDTKSPMNLLFDS